MLHINLGQLVNRKSYTIPYTLFYNRYQVLTSALANSRANAFALINTYTIRLANLLNIPLKELPKLIPICGYNGWIEPPIITILRIYLYIDR